MKAFSDKILLVVGVCALFASAGWTFLSIGGVKAKGFKAVDQLLATTPVEAMQPPAFDSVIPVWEKSGSQDPLDPNWIYGVFTPPKIYVDANGRFSATPPTDLEPVRPPESLGVTLVDIQQAPYRFQFVGYIEEDPRDPKKTLAMLRDRKTNLALRARIGLEFPEEGIRIKDIIIRRDRDEFNNVVRTEQVIIEGISSGSLVTLVHGETKYADDLLIRLQSKETGDIVEITHLDESFEMNNVVYQVLGVDVETSSLVVSKPIETEEGPDTLTKELFITAPVESDTQSTESGISLF